MTNEKSNKVVGITAAAVLAVTAFVAGIHVSESLRHVTSANSCIMHIDASNIDGNITTKLNADGSQESCDALVNQLKAVANGDQVYHDSSDDSDSSGDDAASAPEGASQ